MNHKTLRATLICTAFFTISAFAQPGKLQLKHYEFKSGSGVSINAELGEFEVLENRSKKTGKKIKLSFVRFKSTNPKPGNPIVYLAGGPGGSGINTAKGPRFELFMALRAHADVIALDQRGTGLSNFIPPCQQGAVFDLNEPGKEEIYISKFNAAAKSCMNFWEKQEVDLAAYNTNENADDLEDLRNALDAKQITLWGISYGTHLAFNFVKRHPKSVDKMILASLEGPNHTIKLPSQNQKFLEHLASVVKEDSHVPTGFPDLLQMMERVFTKLESNPAHAKFTDPRTKKDVEVTISKFDLQLVTSYFLLKNPDDSKRMPIIFFKMMEDDYSEVAQFVAILKQYAGQVQAMPFAMDAMSGVSSARWTRVMQESDKALLGSTTNFPFPHVAEGLGLPDLGDNFRKNPKSDVPTLFLSGTLDGRTYIDEAKELVAGFKKGIHVIVDGAGHDLFMSSPEIERTILYFLENNRVNTSIIKVPVPEFVFE